MDKWQGERILLRQWVRPQTGVVSLTQDGHTTSILQSGQAKCYSVADTQRLRSKARDDVTGRWDQDQYRSKGMISGL